jgi:hypothetical protein
MRWTNKRGRISFFLIPTKDRVSCARCPFIHNPICREWNKANPARYATEHLCNMLWIMKGDNQFENRLRINAWQPLGPLRREKKKKDKF